MPVGTPIAIEVKGPELRTAGYPVLDRYDLPTDGTLGDYAAHGYHYLVVNAFVVAALPARREEVPGARELLPSSSASVVTCWSSSATPTHATGPHLKLYYMDPAILAARTPTEERRGHESVARTTGSTHPKPLYPVGEEILGNPPRVSPVRSGG